MKVKIGNKVYDGDVEPVMVILSRDDKKHISQMAPYARKYCCFPDDMPEDVATEFMKVEEP